MRWESFRQEWKRVYSLENYITCWVAPKNQGLEDYFCYSIFQVPSYFSGVWSLYLNSKQLGVFIGKGLVLEGLNDSKNKNIHNFPGWKILKSDHDQHPQPLSMDVKTLGGCTSGRTRTLGASQLGLWTFGFSLEPWIGFGADDFKSCGDWIAKLGWMCLDYL